MSFQDDYEDDDDPELHDGDSPDADIDEDESSDTERCPHCGKRVYEQAELCPHCHNYISREDSRTRKPLWIIIGVIVTLAVMVWYWIL